MECLRFCANAGFVFTKMLEAKPRSSSTVRGFRGTWSCSAKFGDHRKLETKPRSLQDNYQD